MSGAPVALDRASRFVLLGQLGAGGMGSVFEAIDQVRATRVAVKTLREDNPGALFYLKNEFRALADVRHPNLAHLIELVEEAGRFFIVMELVHGEDLLRYVRPEAVPALATHTTVTVRGERLEPEAQVARRAVGASVVESSFDEARLRDALGQLASGLVALHDKGKLHGDVKPSNVLVTAEGRVVLVDFGLTREVDGALRATLPSGLGTRAFMAPEQVALQELTSAADWYSFGVILHVALTGELPFRGGELLRKQLTGPLALETLDSSLPPDLVELTLALLAPEAPSRPSGREVLARFGRGAPGAGRQGLPFFGRSLELEALSAALRRSRVERETVLVVGDSGLGKSYLVREWAARVRSEKPDTLVFSGRCYERELVPYKALDGIVDALSRWLAELDAPLLDRFLPADATLLARVFPVLGSIFPSDGGFPLELDKQELRARAFSALRELFERVAAEQAVVLFVDDLQWADADSHLLLSDLLRSPGAPRVTFVATLRQDAASRQELKDLFATWGKVVHLSLSPLAPLEARELALAVLGGAANESLVASVALEAGGHPLFLQALCLHVEQQGELAPGGLRLEEAFSREIDALDPEAQRLLELVSVSGAPLSARLALGALELSPLAYAASLALLNARRLVRGTALGREEQIEAYHDRIRETVLSRLDPSAKRSRHSELARSLEQLGASDQEALALVRHLEGAGRTHDAGQHALLAAARAEQALAFDQAAELYRTALRLGSDDRTRRVTLLRSLVSALAAAGRASEAAAACLELVPEVPAAERLAVRRLAADHLLRSGYLEPGSAILSEVLREFGTDLLSQRRSLFTMLTRRWMLGVRGLDWQESASGHVKSGLLERVDAYHAVGVSLSLIDPVRGGAFEIRALELALEAGDPQRLVPTLVMETGYEASIGARGIERSRRLLEEARSVAERTGDNYGRAAVRMMDGFVNYHAGHFVGASARLAEVELEFQRLPGRYFEQAFCHCFGRICLRNAGRFGELERGYESWVRLAERRNDRFTEAVLRFNLNGIWLVRDQPDEAERDLARVHWIPPQGGYHVQHWYEAQARAEIDLYRGQSELGLARFREEMKALSRSFILRMRLHRCHAQWILGRTILAEAACGREGQRGLNEVKVLARRLRRERVGFADVWSLLLSAGRAACLSESERTAELLWAAHGAAREADIAHAEHTAAYFLSDYEPGPVTAGLRREALQWAEVEGLRSPERFFQSWGAGLSSGSK
jgi:eukaryotic-like serine/threonine-protein kinase